MSTTTNCPFAVYKGGDFSEHVYIIKNESCENVCPYCEYKKIEGRII